VLLEQKIAMQVINSQGTQSQLQISKENQIKRNETKG
jgi:hypothetical protein